MFITKNRMLYFEEIAKGILEISKGNKVLIEDLFEYTKLSSEGIKLNRRLVAVNEFLEQLVEELVPIGEENEIAIVKDFPSEKVILNLDVDKILRVFENLIMNAIKYSYSPGEIKVHIYKEEQGAVISVHNRGDNISDDEINKIFDRFYRLEKSRSSNTGGSELGLAIAKSIVELHGGKIWAESKSNIISFYVKLAY